VALDWFDRRAQNGLQRLYDEALACRMRPFRDGTQPLPLLVRTVARSLGKRVTLRIEGEGTQVDRDLLSRLDAPLGHLLRNAIDHGIESPDERRAAGKPEEGTLRLEARHSAGRLHITLSDDGRGVDLEGLRARIVARNLINAEAAGRSPRPNCSSSSSCPGSRSRTRCPTSRAAASASTPVRDMVTQVRGTVKVTTTRGAGTQFRLQLPVTLSVLRGLIVERRGEPYAFPLSTVTRAMQLPVERGGAVGGAASLRPRRPAGGPGVGASGAGLHRDRAAGRHARRGGGWARGRRTCGGHRGPLPRRARAGGAAARSAARQDQGHFGGGPAGRRAPVLIVDVEDCCTRSPSWRATAASPAPEAAAVEPRARRKRVLIVEDSLTVRELERKMLLHHGYDVDVAVDGMDGWNAVREGGFDLVVTDVDMPRMDGIELVSLITRDPQLRSTPVMIVSYKDREEDRRRGLEAGAAYYFTKGSFHDETLVQAVVDLIGEARS
jgi:two-component system sensor histidine kinase and response regulator WspE